VRVRCLGRARGSLDSRSARGHQIDEGCPPSAAESDESHSTPAEYRQNEPRVGPPPAEIAATARPPESRAAARATAPDAAFRRARVAYQPRSRAPDARPSV